MWSLSPLGPLIRQRPMTFHDIRLAVRGLVLDRSVSAIVILFFALGIGVNASHRVEKLSGDGSVT